MELICQQRIDLAPLCLAEVTNCAGRLKIQEATEQPKANQKRPDCQSGKCEYTCDSYGEAEDFQRRLFILLQERELHHYAEIMNHASGKERQVVR